MLKSIAIAAAATLLATSPAWADITFQPITCPMTADAGYKILGAKGELDGVDSEYAWLASQRPGFKVQRQMETNANGADYDVLEITKGEEKQTICFDITDFFGKMG